MFATCNHLPYKETENCVKLLVSICCCSVVHLYNCAGKDGRDFITVEHCGDDYLAALADSMPDSEDWDDLQAVEYEACGALSNILGKEIPDDSETENDENLGSQVNDRADSPEPSAQEHFDKLDSSTDEEDPDFEILDGHDIASTPSFSLDGNQSRSHAQSSNKYPSRKSVCV